MGKGLFDTPLTRMFGCKYPIMQGGLGERGIGRRFPSDAGQLNCSPLRNQ